MIRQILFISTLFVCSAGLVLGPAASVTAQNVPYTIPEFTFYRMDDSPFTRKDLSTNTHIVFVFISTTCHHCQEETRAMGQNFADFSQSTLYFVTREGKDEINQFMNEYGKALRGKANVHVLLDPRSEFVTKFNPTQFPSVYVYTPTRRLVKHFSGETPIGEITAVLK